MSYLLLVFEDYRVGLSPSPVDHQNADLMPPDTLRLTWKDVSRWCINVSQYSVINSEGSLCSAAAAAVIPDVGIPGIVKSDRYYRGNKMKLEKIIYPPRFFIFFKNNIVCAGCG